MEQRCILVVDGLPLLVLNTPCGTYGLLSAIFALASHYPKPRVNDYLLVGVKSKGRNKSTKI